ncbi:hypothetical protein [Salinibaculum salinum]|uniref:hypothetical protein n=1 Tax=Salinibaculum salinum TaxID=3131996 RepID=UPI0030EDA546
MAADERTAASQTVLSTRTVFVGLVLAAVMVGVSAAVIFGGGLDTVALENSDDEENTQPTIVDVSGNTTVTVTYTTADRETDEFVVDGVAPELSDSVNGWAFVDKSALPTALERRADTRTDSIVPVGHRVLIGNVTSSTRQVGTATVTVVAPAGRGVDPTRKSYFISEFLSPYSLNPDKQAVTVVAAPDALPYKGLTYADGTSYVTIEAFWDGDVGSVWLHETVHTRQSFTLDREMKWFREASAEYLTYRALQEQYEQVDDSDVRARLDAVPDYHEARLSAPSTWGKNPVDYTRGVRLLYAIDAAVRTGSGGDHTLFDVFYAMNQRDGTVTLQEFRHIVENHSGDDEAWIEHAITGPGQVSQYHDATDVFVEG